jgi:hypothetical protein
VEDNFAYTRQILTNKLSLEKSNSVQPVTNSLR